MNSLTWRELREFLLSMTESELDDTVTIVDDGGCSVYGEKIVDSDNGVYIKGF